MEIIKYPDNTSYVKVKEFLPETTFRLNSYEDLWHLNQYVDASYNFCNTKSTIIIPNLIDAQSDRRFGIGESSGLKLVCDFLNQMNANFKIFHPHNQEVVEALINNLEIIDNEKFIREVFSELLEDKRYDFDSEELENQLILMSSDAGGFKPLSKLCDKLSWEGEMYSASKARSWDEKNGTKFIQQIDRTDFKGKDILIIDDICVYGGTFKGLSKLLKERNCGKLYLAVSHMTVQNLGEDSVTNYFDRVFTTNSKYDFYQYINWSSVIEKEIKNLEIIKLF